MSYREVDFAQEIALTVLIHKWKTPSLVTSELAAITAALASDVTTRDKTIQTPPAALKIHFTQTRFTNDINLIVNKGKAGNLHVDQMISAIDDAVGVVHKPAWKSRPFAQMTSAPPIATGSTANCTQGIWTGAPSSYAYQWQRDGVNATGAGALTANYTLVAGDVGGHQLTCIVTASNAQGATTTPAVSNAIAT